ETGGRTLGALKWRGGGGGGPRKKKRRKNRGGRGATCPPGPATARAPPCPTTANPRPPNPRPANPPPMAWAPIPPCAAIPPCAPIPPCPPPCPPPPCPPPPCPPPPRADAMAGARATAAPIATVAARVMTLFRNMVRFLPEAPPLPAMLTTAAYAGLNARSLACERARDPAKRQCVFQSSSGVIASPLRMIPPTSIRQLSPERLSSAV